MDGDIRFILKPDWMVGLGNLAGYPITSVSPFKMGKSTDLTANDLKELGGIGILDGSGKISIDYQPVIRTMALAQSFARVRLTGGEGVFEYVTYSSEGGCDSFSLTTIPEGLEVRDPAPTAEIIEMLKQYTGDSMIRGSSFEAEINNAEAVVLAAIIDIERKAVLNALCGGTQYVPGVISMESLYQSMDSNSEDAQWLLAVVNGLIDSAPERPAIEKAVESLQIAGHLKRTDSGIKPGRKLEVLASRIPVIDKLLSLRSGLDLGNGQVVQVGFVCIQAGVNDMLMIESLGGLIHFEAVSPALVLEYVSHFLYRPDVLNSVIVKIESGKGSKENKGSVKESIQTEERVKDLVRNEPVQAYCSACNSQIPPNGRFCISCGKPVSISSNSNSGLCTHCGSPIKLNANFCNKCGVRVNTAG